MKNKNSGITLISLAVTILVMLILAAVGLNLGLGDNGIVGQTQNAVNQYQTATNQEQGAINDLVSDMNEAINGGSGTGEGEEGTIQDRPSIEIVDWNDNGGIVQISTNPSYTTEYKIGNGEWKEYPNTSVEVPNGSTIYARYKDDEGHYSQIISQIIKDTTPPVLTGSLTGSTATTATVSVSATDNEMGMPDPIVYKYYIKTQNDNSYKYITSNNTGRYTYTDLNSSTIYQLMVTADDKAGNTGEIKIDSETGEAEAPDIEVGTNIFFTLDPNGPTKGTVNVSIRTSGIDSSYYIEYSTNNGSSYTRYTNAVPMTSNGRVYARVTNGSKTSNSVYVDVTNIDKDNPTINVQVTDTTENSITIKATAKDQGLGMPSPTTYKYYIREKDTGDYQSRGENTTGETTFSDLQEGKTYDIRVTATDRAGNEGEGVIQSQTNIILPPELVVDENISFTLNPTTPTKDTVNVTIEVTGVNSKFYIEYSINNENNYTRYTGPVPMTSNGRVYARVTDGTNNSNSVYIDVTNIDKDAPTGTLNISNVSTKAMTATVSEVTDTGLAMPSQVEYSFYIRKEDESYGAAAYTGTQTTHEFSGLDHDTTYEVKVTFKDLAGNEAELTKQQGTVKVPDLNSANTTLTLSETRITNKPITVTINCTVSNGYTLQYSTNGSTYQNYTGPITIEGNTRIYTRLWDDRDSTGNYGGTAYRDITNINTSLSDLEVLIERDEYVEENTPVTDENGNKITIPEGFKPKDDSTTVDGGIVVEDKNGNQFVWIPVGQLKLPSGGTVTINYDRYAYSNWKTNGTDSATGSTKIQTTETETEYFAEALNQSEKDSAVNNGGFYLGRYEAGTNHERTSATGTSDPLQIKQNSNIYNWVTYSEARTLAQGMYASSNYTSSLTSSYAWDTALKFLEQTGNTSYLTNSTQGNYYNTQHGGKSQTNANVLLTAGETQKVNNLYDLGGNVYEWTTEQYSNAEAGRVSRGGFFGFNSQDEPVIGRFSSSNTADSAIGFRVALFIGQVTRPTSSLALAKSNGTQFDKTTELEDDVGKTLVVPKNFKVSTDSNTVIDDGAVIEELGTGNQFVWVPVPDPTTMFEEQTATLTGVETTTNIYSKLRQRSGDSYSAGAPGTSGIREPDVLSRYDTDSQYYQDILGFDSTKAMADSMVAEYKAMSESIKKYHGFWIGRYELTGTTEKPTVKSGDVLTAAEAGNWYGLYKACQNVIRNNTDVKSTMIYGCQWDETMSWLKNTEFKGREDKVDTDSSSWGNYGSGSPINTGSVSTYKANEIFDLAGNYYDWTQEAYYTIYRVLRGGGCNNSGSSVPAADRGVDSAFSNFSYNSSRAVLYIL